MGAGSATGISRRCVITRPAVVDQIEQLVNGLPSLEVDPHVDPHVDLCTAATLFR